MNAPPPVWLEANRALMIAAIEQVRGCLDAHARQERVPADQLEPLLAAVAERGAPSALASLCTAFSLSRFERDVLLLCAAYEMDGSLASACAAASDARRPYPTFALAMAALPRAHWSAITPGAPLRHFRLVELDPSEGLAFGRLRIDEPVLHFLAGVPWLDSRLLGLLEPVRTDLPALLVGNHREAADRVAAVWRRTREQADRLDASALQAAPERHLAIQLTGSDAAARELVLAEACRGAGTALLALRAADVPGSAIERDALARLWQRESALSAATLLIDIDDREDAETLRAISALVERLRGPLAISARDPLPLRRRPSLRIELAAHSTSEHEQLWRAYLGPLGERLDGAVGRLASHFQLGPSGMRAVVAEMSERLEQPGQADGDANVAAIADNAWSASRRQARPRLDDLAQRIEPSADFRDLVLPAEQMDMLRGVLAHVRQRTLVYEQWGFARRGGRGLGITALFSGASGTGKTLGAEVLAKELALDLYRIDLSQVVSKYIGETEKNLRRVFDAAEEGGAILLFDEADALFGKRSEVKDSHDRYANLEISYLLQRMEAYRGLAILTSNMRSALDAAFTRRLRFIVEFPFPGQDERAAIWKRVFPADVPREAIAVERLAKLNVTGGIIRNIALGAAFLAADLGQPVRMEHLRRAAALELQKLERTATDAELGGWA